MNNKKELFTTFIENKTHNTTEFNPGDVVFSIPYTKIITAQNFCKAEELEFCYLGHREFKWCIQMTPEGIDPYIKVTQTGFAQSVRDAFIITTSRV